MRVSREAAAASKARITREAARLMRKNGIGGTSVSDVMSAAGMTTGGFYKHFGSKEELTAAAVRQAFDEILGKLEANGKAKGAAAAAQDYFETYLSTAHVKKPAIGCPVASLGTDAGREGHSLGPAFAEGIDKTLQLLSGGEPTKAQRAELIRTMSLLVGAVVIARALGTGDLQEEILAAARSSSL